MAFILSGHWSARNMDCISTEGGQSRQRATTAALFQLISGDAITEPESKEGRNEDQEKALGLAYVELQAFWDYKIGAV